MKDKDTKLIWETISSPDVMERYYVTEPLHASQEYFPALTRDKWIEGKLEIYDDGKVRLHGDPYDDGVDLYTVAPYEMWIDYYESSPFYRDSKSWRVSKTPTLVQGDRVTRIPGTKMLFKAGHAGTFYIHKNFLSQTQDAKISSNLDRL